MPAARRARGLSAMLCSLRQSNTSNRRDAKSRKRRRLNSRSLEYTAVLPASWQRARDAASSILNLAEPALLPCVAVLPRRWREFA